MIQKVRAFLQQKGARNYKKIEGYVANLRRRGFSLDEAHQFTQGFYALQGNSHILSETGQTLLSQSSVIIDSDFTKAYATFKEEFNAILPQLPTVKEPKLDLFISPSAYLSEAEKTALIEQIKKSYEGMDYVAISISEGCQNNCLVCGFGDSPKITYMPYPMILAIAKEFFGSGSTIMPYKQSDPFYYRDEAFDADFGDVAARFKESEIGLSVISHGWWKGDKYAPVAAEKFRQLGFNAAALSIHLFHSQILSAQGNPQRMERTIDSFVERFRIALELLKPKEVRLMGNPNRMPGPREWSREYLEDLFNNRIALPDFKCQIARPTPYYEGKATSLAKAGYFYKKASISKWQGTDTTFRPDGSVTVAKKELKFPKRENGALTIKEIFKGPEDIKFKWFIHIIIEDFIHGINKEKVVTEYTPKHQIKIPPDYQNIIAELLKAAIKKISFSTKTLVDLTPEFYASFFDKLSDLPLPYPEFPPVMTFGEILPKVWEAIKGDYPELNGDFGSFFSRCIEVWKVWEANMKREILDWGLNEEDSSMLEPLMKHSSLLQHIKGGKEALRTLFSHPMGYRMSPEEAMEGYGQLKDLPAYFDPLDPGIHFYLGNSQAASRSPAFERTESKRHQVFPPKDPNRPLIQLKKSRPKVKFSPKSDDNI